MASSSKPTHTVTYVQVGETKGTFKFQPEDEDGPVTGTLYARKSGTAADLKAAEKLTVTLTVG